MIYSIKQSEPFSCRYTILLNYEVIHRQIIKYLNTTPRDKCTSLVNDLFDEVNGIISITLAPNEVTIEHSPMHHWESDILPSVLEILRFNFEPQNKEKRNVRNDKGIHYYLLTVDSKKVSGGSGSH